MTPEKVLSVVAIYEQRFNLISIRPARINPHTKFSECTREALLCHALHLIHNVRRHIADGHHEKAHRHLGSLQTILGFLGWYSLTELIEHNRPLP